MAPTSSTGNNKKKNFIMIVGILVLVIGVLAGIYLVQTRITTQNRAAEEFTHQITCTVGDVPDGKTCTVSVDGSPDSPQAVDPGKSGHPNYLFKVKMDTPDQKFTCKLDCGIPACIPTDQTTCSPLPEPTNSPTPTPSPTPEKLGECGDPCGDNIAQCRQDLFCNQDGKCDHEIECPKPSVTPTVTPTNSPTPTATPTATPTPAGPTPTLPPGVTPSVTPTSTPKPTATLTPTSAPSPTPTTVIVCAPPDHVANLSISCTTGTCSWTGVSGTDKYKVAVTDTTTGKKLAEFEPFKEVEGTSTKFTAEANHTYICTVEAVNSCGTKQASSPYRDSETCTSTKTSSSPTPTDIIVVNKTPSSTPTSKVPTPTLKPGVSPSVTPVPTLPVAGQINLSLWAVVGIAAIVFGLIAFR